MTLPLVPQRTTPGFVFSNIERAISDCLGHRQFGASEKAAVIAFFGDEIAACVFCGDTNVGRWDHLVSINQGGETILGNMVLACAACDDSKQHRPFDVWMRSSAPGSPTSRHVVDVEARIVRIKEYVAHYKYVVEPLDERLDDAERAALVNIRQKLQEARREADALIERYRSRTGRR